uniref:Uncharacterized protein n=1 Tax=Utricularia reniformis TaxID=192314 RepID=A0A1Y0B2K6_9LAMI|nr:hypothetical protein AEK19_MT1491 [Utricularia reniformis]ART31682.1 hypothetical protein AEK19_MT1491 [Utricularia reniformis]
MLVPLLLVIIDFLILQLIFNSGCTMHDFTGLSHLSLLCQLSL